MLFDVDFPYVHLEENPTNVRVGEFGFMNPVPLSKPPYPPGPWYEAYWAGMMK